MVEHSEDEWDELARQLDPATIDVLFPHVVEGPERQGRTWDGLDRKALGVLTTASVTIGLTVFALAHDPPTSALVFLGLAIASYGVGASCTIGMTLWTANWFSTRHPDVLLDTYAKFSARETKRWMIQRAVIDTQENDRVLKRKARGVQRGLIALGTQVVFLGVAVLLILICG